MPLGFGFHLPNKVEISAVLHRVEEGPSLRPLVGQKHGGGQMPRVGVNGITEQGELNQRNAQHHGEGKTVTSHLQKFLCNNAAQALERKFGMSFHADFGGCSIKLMKASSKPGGIFFQT